MDYDVHYQLNGFFTVEAENPEEARRIVNEMIHAAAQRAVRELHLDIVDDEEDYVTDVLSVV